MKSNVKLKVLVLTFVAPVMVGAALLFDADVAAAVNWGAPMRAGYRGYYNSRQSNYNEGDNEGTINGGIVLMGLGFIGAMFDAANKNKKR